MNEKKRTVIKARNVTFSFDGKPVLEDVDFTVDDRDFVSIIGPNGGGKTTLLKLILGIYQPDRGSIEVYGTSPHRARNRIGYVPQTQRYDPKFPARVMDIVLMGRLDKTRLIGPYRREDKDIARSVLQRVGLLDLAHRPLAALSGGQQQRVNIARALACEPEMLLLDEPTASLDLTVEASLYDLLRVLNKQLTIVMVSHDIGFVSELVSKVLCVKRKVMSHPTTEITADIINEIYGSEVHMVRHDHHES